MSSWADIGGEEEDEEEQQEQKEANNSKMAVVFLIDARANMYEPNDNKELPISNALNAALQQLKMKIITSDNDLCSVWLVGTNEKKNDQGTAHVYEILPLGNPSAQAIKTVQAHMEDVASLKTKVGCIPSSAEFPLTKALWAAAMTLAGNVKPTDVQQFWVFTNDDDPFRNHPAAVSKCVQQAKDLADANQVITLWSSGTAARPFNADKFYTGIVAAGEDGSAHDLRSMDNLEELTNRLRTKQYAKRVYARIPWVLAEGLELSIGVYNNVYETKKPYAVQLEARTNEPLTTETNWLCADTGKQLMDHEIRTYHTFGGEKVFFTKDDMKAIKDFGPAGITLLGFKPISHISNIHNMRAPYFLYPLDDVTAGSATAFTALWSKMLDMGKVAIARMILRVGTAPRLVALMAQREQYIDDGSLRLTPSGIYAIPLPFADDIRDLHFDPIPKSAPAQVDIAKQVVRSVDLKTFSSFGIDNPVLQKHYAAVQAMALDEPALEWDDSMDHTLPDAAGLAPFHTLLEAYREAFGGSSDASAKPAAARKRATTTRATGSASTAPPAAKRARGATGKSAAAAGGGDDDDDDDDDDGTGAIDWAAAAADGSLATFTIPVLKVGCEKYKLPKSGKKADLVDRLMAKLAK